MLLVALAWFFATLVRTLLILLWALLTIRSSLCYVITCALRNVGCGLGLVFCVWVG